MRKLLNSKYFKLIFYVTCFIAFSFLGSLMEYLFGFFGGTGFAYNRMVEYFFHIKIYFIPYYGTTSLILLMSERFLDKRKIKFVYRGLLIGIIITIWELISGLFTLSTIGINFWDYSSQPFNFLGVISLKMSLLWVGVGYLFSLIYQYILKPVYLKLRKN